MAIQVLDQSTINQIAAGEVVERPASVVKELMENAIDAGATAITVEIRDGGIGFIRITDNGCGIPKEEIPTAFLRHSTSKIRSAEDLLTVSSLGFRGEALSSISAVSQVELITKVSGSLTGSRFRIEGGEEKGLEEIGAPDGTTFISRNLFFNTPARRKFLKTAATEGGHVADLVEKIALSHPEISIRLIVNNQNKLHTSGNHNLKDIIYTVYGREIAASLIPIEVQNEAVRITGFIGKPVIARGNRNFENYFINGRYIKSGLISKAIEDGYKSYMMQHKYPFTLLHFSIEPEYIDVNVHPSKMELRFKEGELMYRTICQVIAGALGRNELIPQVELSGESREPQRPKEPQRPSASSQMKQPQNPGTSVQTNLLPKPEVAAQTKQPPKPETAAQANLPGQTGQIGQTPRMPLNVKTNIPQPAENQKPVSKSPLAEQAAQPATGTPGSFTPGPAHQKTSIHRAPEPFEVKRKAAMGVKEQPSSYHEPEAEAVQMELFDGRLLSKEARYQHRLIGQVFDTYWLVEYNGQLYIIDQHAAHEKVLFEKTFASLKSREYTSQLISPPIILTLSMQEADLLERHMDTFTKMGFEIEHFGGNEYAVRAVPDNLFSLAKKDLLLEMLDGLTEDAGPASSEAIYDRIATMSCKAAVKGNNRLSSAEADQLIDQLLKLENPYACPHGRPTIVAISKYEMEKKFKRIV